MGWHPPLAVCLKVGSLHTCRLDARLEPLPSVRSLTNIKAESILSFSQYFINLFARDSSLPPHKVISFMGPIQYTRIAQVAGHWHGSIRLTDPGTRFDIFLSSSVLRIQ